jgi:hypothetical protein
MDRPLRIACTEVELGGRCSHLLEHEVRIEPYDGAVHRLARAAEVLDSAVVQKLDADLGDQPPPAPLDHSHRLFGEHLVARHDVLEHGEGRLTESAARHWARYVLGGGFGQRHDIPTAHATARAWPDRSRWSPSP